MRTTLTLADDVYEAVRTLAQASGRPFGAVASEVLRRGLQPRVRVASESDPTWEIPHFHVPSDAPIIPGDRASELQADEGAD